jgi:hypothetical protein
MLADLIGRDISLTWTRISGSLGGLDDGRELPDADELLDAWPAGSRIYWRGRGSFLTIDDASETAKLQVAFVRITQDLLS